MWQEELTKLRKIQPSADIVQELKSDGIPTLESQVKEETTKLESAQEEVEEVSQLHGWRLIVDQIKSRKSKECGSRSWEPEGCGCNDHSYPRRS